MSIFDPHKNGRAPFPPEPAAPAAVDAEIAARFADAVEREDWYNAWRFYREGGEALLGSGNAVRPLAEYLERENRPDDALNLLQGFASRHPDHPDLVRNYLLAADIMRRHLGDADGARQLLENLAARTTAHPDHPLILARLENPEDT
ncbi:MAG: hypothetical protein Q4D61_07695 [Cardiobacteriaceae bacterium]|nr:hypothetical protein [Cardiobacteriaceae bacterium]